MKVILENSLKYPIFASMLFLVLSTLVVGYFINQPFLDDTLHKRVVTEASITAHNIQYYVDNEIDRFSNAMKIFWLENQKIAKAVFDHGIGGTVSGSWLNTWIYRSQALLGVDFLLITDTTGNILVGTNNNLTVRTLFDHVSFQHVLAGEQVVMDQLLHNEWNALALVPLFHSGKTVGAIIVGNNFGTKLADEFSVIRDQHFQIISKKCLLIDNQKLSRWMPLDQQHVDQAIEGNETVVLDHTIDRGWLYAPLEIFENSYCLLIPIDQKNIHEILRSSRSNLIKSLLTTIFLVIILGFVINRIALLPLRRLKETALNVIEEYIPSTAEIFHNTTPPQNEILALNEAFSILTRTISLHINNLEAEKLYNEQLIDQKNSMMETASDAIMLIDVDSGRILEVNRMTETILDRPRQEIIGQPLHTFYPSDEEAGFSSLLQGASSNATLHCLKRAGTWVPVEIRTSKVNLDGKDVIQGIFRDITERKEAEKKDKAAHESRLIINQLLETALDPMSLDQQLVTILEIIFSTFWFKVLPKGAIFLTDPESGKLVLTVHKGFSDEQVKVCERIDPGQCLCGKAFQSGQLLFSSCIDDQHDIQLEGTSPHGHYIVPIMTQNRCYGVINLYLAENHVRDAEEETFLLSLAQTIVGLIDRRKMEDKIKEQAEVDKLTGLPNRALFQIRLKQHIEMAERSNQEVVVMFLDLDRFKFVNDTMGHEAGDRLLRIAAERIIACVRHYDTVSRLGGDEFTIILPQLTHVCYVEFVARRILEELTQPFDLPQGKASISCSIGIALYPDDGREMAELLKNADTAMYHAKDSGRNNFSFFTPEMQTQAIMRLEMDKALRAALENNEFELFYQPKQELESGRISSMEALIRWNRTDVGMVSPNAFIPLAEEIGLIIPLGEWVLRNACQQNKIWQDQGYPPMRVAVNLSPRQFKQSDTLIATIMAILRESGLNAEYLELEITESMVMDDVDDAIQTMLKLKEMGIQIAVDDFGTGHSSLGSLKKFPIRTLKIDRSFVKDLSHDADDTAIVLAILSLARQLKLKTVAEGVETVEQATFLHENGCDEIQGYFLSKPLSVKDFTHFLDLRKQPSG